MDPIKEYLQLETRRQFFGKVCDGTWWCSPHLTITKRYRPCP